MSARFLLAFVFAFLSNLLAIARDDDPKEKLFKAKAAYTAEIAKLRSEVIGGFDKREEKARSVGNKKLVDEIKLQRAAFEEGEEWPADMPAELRTRLTKVRTQVEVAYQSAIKDYTKTKKDDEAAAMEKDLVEFRRQQFWPLLDLAKVEIKEGFFRIPAYTSVATQKPYKGGVEITMVAKTEGGSIRLHAHRGSSVIFNWEDNPAELRVCRPDGKEDGTASGSLATAKVTRLKPNTYYTFRWRLTPEGMAVFMNGEIVFTEKKEYNLDADTNLAVESFKSAIEVKEFKVTRIAPKQ